MVKAIFFDRDGTLNVDNGYTCKINDFKLIEGVWEALKILHDKNYKLIIVTNQAGIGRRLYSEGDYFRFRNHMHEKLMMGGIKISAEYFCPHHPEFGIGDYRIECECRKPKTEMFEKAAKDFNLNLKECWMVGDKISDIEAGKKAGCKTIHVLTGVEKQPAVNADFIAKNLIEAADFIISKDTNK